ncbi:hypothetical protein WBG78_09025 [Chryseolinea sp. T2]|uniref:bestrophin-like domain n=1 Tax=Chryseolinea sp. T2 TaxID=3129255 RepID=UPI0030781916
MYLSFYYSIDTALLAFILFLLMISFIVLGRVLSKDRITSDHTKNPGNAAMVTSLYALLGLLLAFTFGMSGDRFRQRRTIIVEEANAIGTATLRLQLYADSVQPGFRKYFADYLEARISYFDAGTDTAKIREALVLSQTAADSLWHIATSNSRIPSNLVASNQMVPALNQMFDIANSRFWSEYNRTPASILSMLFILCLSSAFVAGHTSVGEGKFDWFMAVGFCVLIASVIYFIIDLDRPRAGTVTLQDSARAISDLRSLLKP